MRIISKQHDYYDSVQAFGQDQSLVFVRKPEETIIDTRNNQKLTEMIQDLPRGSGRWRSSRNYNYTTYIIGFCGKLYPLFHLKYSTYSYTEEDIEEFAYENNDFIKFFEAFDKRTKEKATETYRDTSYSVKNMRRGITEQYMSILFDKYHGTDKFFDMFFDIRSPIFILDLSDMKYEGYCNEEKFFKNIKMTKNPVLRDYHFYKIFDAFTTYQEIDMFMSGVFGNQEKNTIDISDTDMRDAKGFDAWSFKKYPTKKGKRK